MNPSITSDQLRDHYKHCIRLSASNKINAKNAFNLNLIDYMQDLVKSPEDGQMNFKIASSALDVGAKIYSNRVDCIQSEAQKVASSILLAVDGKQDGNDKSKGDTTDEANDTLNDSRADDDDSRAENAHKKKRHQRSKNVKTVVEDESLINGKLEKIVLGDSYIDNLAKDIDISCLEASILYNALSQPSGLLTIDSNNLRSDYTELSTPQATFVIPDPPEPTPEDTRPPTSDSVTIPNHLAQLLRTCIGLPTCPRLEEFLFNDRTTTIAGFNSNTDDVENARQSPLRTSGAQDFNPELYVNNNDDDHFSAAGSMLGDHDDDDEADELKRKLDEVASTKPTDYGYTNEHPRLLRTWAGPNAWKPMKAAPGTVKKDAPPKSARKRTKVEHKPHDFTEPDTEEPDKPAVKDRDIRISSNQIQKWKVFPWLKHQDFNLDEESTLVLVKTTFFGPESTYHCMKTPADALKQVNAEHDYSKMENDASNYDAPNSPLGCFNDDVHDDSDDEFRADPGQEVAIYGGNLNDTLTQHGDLEFAGEHLIEQPYTVAQVHIPFAKRAKKMDIRKLKRVMLDILTPSVTKLDNTMQANTTVIDNNGAGDTTLKEVDNTGSMNGTVIMNGGDADKTASPAPSEPLTIKFSELYGDLPSRVNQKMSNDLSKPIAFVTLLHLANEKNLKLTPTDDLKDFTIQVPPPKINE